MVRQNARVTEFLSDPTSPVSPPERTGWTRLGLKEPFWIVLGIWVGMLCGIVLANLAGVPGIVVVLIAACAACGAGWYLLNGARQTGETRLWHWMLAGGGTYVLVWGLFGLLLMATDSGVVEVVVVILGLVGTAGCFFTAIGMLIYAVAKRPSSVPAAMTSQRQMVAPIIGYSAEGTPVYGQPGYMQPQNAGTNVFAILALIFGILGGLLAIVFGHIALSQIHRTGEQGRGLAIAGLVLGYIFLAFWVIFLVGFLSYAA